MKKVLLTAAMAIVMGFCVMGCSRSTDVSIDVHGIGDYKVTEFSSDFKNYSTDMNTIHVTVDKDGEYPFTVKDKDGKEYKFVLKVKDGNAVAECDDEEVGFTVAYK